jgi:2-polyprenyl-3-methyl-5-hydroxy-6-metoxy-1,4-benzoquinol methylase
MTIHKCRVCDENFFETPLLKYANMPSIAQHLPDKDSLREDRGIDLEICQCSGCGLVQLSNDPVDYYREVIRAVGISEEMKEFRLNQFKSFIEKYSLTGKKIIEIGCGKGEYMKAVQNAGNFKPYGIEYSQDSVKKCLEENLDVSKEFIETTDHKINQSPFDAFYILNYLEHLPYPNITFNGIYNNLSPEGVGIVEVPNFDMILRENLFSEFMRDHLFYFTKETLKSTLEKNNFEIIECEETWHNYILSATIKKSLKNDGKQINKKIEKMDLSSFKNHQDSIIKEVNNYIDNFGDNQVAIWGAGHQSFAIMSLAGLQEKVKYVLDSATFKQGKYTPSTHIPIVHPDKLNLDPVDSIIIIAGSYSDEVAKIIQKKYNKNLEIAILRESGLEKIK